MRQNGLISAEQLRQLLIYDPVTGVFRWKITTNSRAKAGSIAGTLCNGYRVIRIDKRGYRAHRLAWLYVYGCWPIDQIDHRNRIRDDNRLSNLREATVVENAQNSKRKKHASSEFKGLRWHPQTQRWQARIMVAKHRVSLGYFDTAEDAYAAYCEAAVRYFGKFARFV